MNQSEYAILTQLDSLLSQGKGYELKKAKKYQYVLSGIGGILVLCSFYLVSFRIIVGELGIVMAAVGGVIIGMAGYIRIIRGIIPIIYPHLNRESIRTRLSNIKQIIK